MPPATKVILGLVALLVIGAALPRPYAFLPGRVVDPVVQTLVLPGRPVRALLVGDPVREELANQPLDDERLRDDFGLARVELDRLRQQNARLKQRLAELVPAQDLLAERGLRELRPVSARVNPGGGDGVLTIAAGSRDGVQAGQAVVYDVHVVGQVVEPIGPSTASVALITSLRVPLSLRLVAPPSESTPGSLLPARSLPVQVKPDVGRSAFVTEDVAAGADVRVGDLARHADELSLPEAQGFQFGVVSEVTPLERNPLALRRVVVEPVLDLGRLSRVTVLIPDDNSGSGSDTSGSSR